ncbi:S66 family peptidase [Paenibacillus kobensis]|uniref:S66 family peptidase n=1 Tax=Paenibacillus kobensis TaxID=59841 RepID=UPI000FD9544A|nr:S66 peptidase family protein [Paenibacillus kobensis]
MIRYPILEPQSTIGVTAPSSGVSPALHDLVHLACGRLKRDGYNVICGDTVWTQRKAKSAPAQIRAAELQTMLQDDRVQIIIPPWGGELLIELLEHFEFNRMPCKWILGYSDTSGLLLAITLTTGIATAHGTNLIDLRGQYSDETTGMWQSVLSTKAGQSNVQHSSPFHQKEWKHDSPTPCVFHLTEPTCWSSIPNMDIRMAGRLLGGCIDIIRHLIGTPYGDLQQFREKHIGNEPVIWVLENCELSATDLRRSLVQMKLAGWFNGCAGIMFGRSGANQPVDDYTEEDVYRDLSEDLGIPIVFDIDCGHVPPQMTFINGAYAEVEVAGGKGVVKQYFNP